MSSVGSYRCNTASVIWPGSSLINSATSSAGPVEKPSVSVEALEGGESWSRRW